MGVIYLSEGNQRRTIVGAPDSKFNGIDYLEVTVPATLNLSFLKSTPLPDLAPNNIVIAGGALSTPVRVKTVKPAGRQCTIELDAPGDLSIYTLRLIKPNSALPPDPIDPRLAEVKFTFQPELPADWGASTNSKPIQPEAEINYLAKDYASFRRLMLDRMAMLLPGGVEDQPADMQVALVELLAYTADRLSYYQDAVATEAYLGTARSRVSLRRHARLLGYPVHEGCNARVWVCCHLKGAVPKLDVGSDWQFLTSGTEPVTFQPCHRPTLYRQHNQIDLYTWSEDDYTLQAGTTHATLSQGSSPLCLQRGDLLALESLDDEERISGCYIVRLTDVRNTTDPVPADTPGIVEVDWGAEDAVAFDLAVRCQGKPVAVACGNVVLADQGATRPDFPLPGPVPQGANYCPYLPEGPLTYAEPLPRDFTDPRQGDTLTSAAGLLQRDVRAALPSIALHGDGSDWSPAYDVLGSDAMRAVFVVEAENDGSTQLRFGDGNYYGRCLTPGATLTATYRVGNGRAGNVGVDMICRVTDSSGQPDVTVTNPLPAKGGQDPEPAEQVRLFAPQAFRTPRRAVNVDDYAARATSFPGVQRAKADIRWTGSWYTVYLFVDRVGGGALDDDFKRRLIYYLDGYRLAGYDLEIRGATYVPVTIEVTLEIKPGSTPNAVTAALTEAFSNRGDLAGGRRGFFHPDNWTFGQPVYLSRFYKAVLDVPGIAAVDAQIFQRIARLGDTARTQGMIEIGPHEIVDSNGSGLIIRGTV